MRTHTRTWRLAILVSALFCAPAVVEAQIPQPFLGDSLVGRDSFAAYCATCHGADARGDGPLARELKRVPADLTMLATRNHDVFPRERVTAVLIGVGRPIAAHGPTEMPIWGSLFRAFESDARARVRIDNLVNYLETVQTTSGRSSELGAALFRTHCASCHGTDARGAGPLTSELRRLPPSLTSFAVRNGGLFPSERVRRIIDGRDVPAHGNVEMPVWGDAFRRTREGLSEDAVRARIEAIVKYLEAIQERATF
jgi:mono/diheme cytochrome c family protein